MNEFDYEVLQRKRLAQQARRRKSGSKSKMCSLPSDRLTQKQWKERNGEVMTYNMSKPMDWKAFKSLPVDLQSEYIATLCEKHGGTQHRICRELFMISPVTLRKCLSEAGIKYEFNNLRDSNALAQARKEAWERFMHPELETDIMPEQGVEEATSIEEDMAAPERKATMRFDSFTLHFSGPFDREALYNSLAAIIQSGQRVKLEIKCEMEGD